MEDLDFVIIRGQQKFDVDKDISPIELKIENNRIQNMLDKYRKNELRFSTEGILFASSIKNNTEKIFLSTNGLTDAKYGLINDKLQQLIGIINLNEIEKWEEIKKSSRWVNGSFQTQTENRQPKHIAYNFQTKNRGDVLAFTLQLVDSDNKKIEFVDGEKKFPILNFMIEFLA